MTPRSLTHLLGAINVKEYGTLESDFVTEFMPSSEIDTVGVGLNDIDSVRLLLKVPMGQYVGDSIVPMKVDVFKAPQKPSVPNLQRLRHEGLLLQIRPARLALLLNDIRKPGQHPAC